MESRAPSPLLPASKRPSLLPLMKTTLNPEHRPCLPGPSWATWAGQMVPIIPVANSRCLVRALEVPSTKRSYYHYLFKSCKQFHEVNAPVSPIF